MTSWMSGEEWLARQIEELEHNDFTMLEDGLLRHHPEAQCSGRCPIHAPTNHHMVDWPLKWRDDRGFMERRCPHGVGHPDPDDMKVRLRRGYGIHGCDGCCNSPEGWINTGDTKSVA